MPTKTSQTTAPDIMNTTRATEPKFGSDAYMVRRGYRPASPQEQEIYGKFVKREGAFSVLYGLARRWAKDRKQPKIRIVALRTEGAISPLGHQEVDQSDTRQAEAASMVVFQQQSGLWQKESLEPELALQH
jgi:hypothetical protein